MSVQYHRSLTRREGAILEVINDLLNARKPPTFKRIQKDERVKKFPVISSLDLLKNVYGFIVNPVIEGQVQQEILVFSADGRKTLRQIIAGTYVYLGEEEASKADANLGKIAAQPVLQAFDLDDNDDDDDLLPESIASGVTSSTPAAPGKPAAAAQAAQDDDDEGDGKEGPIDDGKGAEVARSVLEAGGAGVTANPGALQAALDKAAAGNYEPAPRVAPARSAPPARNKPAPNTGRKAGR